MTRWLDETGNIVGLPRPIDRSRLLPVAYAMGVHPGMGDELPVVDYVTAGTDRDAQCVDDEVCHVCGLELGDDRWGAVMLSSIVAGQDNIDVQTWTVALLDNWSMHERCIKLACSHCPKLRETLAINQLAVIRESYRAVRPDPRPGRAGQTITVLAGDVEEAALWFEQHHQFAMRAQPAWVKARERELGREAQIISSHTSFRSSLGLI